MKVVEYKSYGGVDVLNVVERPVPTPGVGQLRVAVRAMAINPIDWKVMSGKFRLVVPVKRPAVPVFDLVGVVEEVGPDVDDFVVGQRVFVRNDIMPGGAAAESAVVSASVTALAPDGVDDAQLAAVPLAGMTALQGLRTIGGLADGKRVLVLGASGGVGHIAVQLAHDAGAHVTGVCSAANAAFVRNLGADDVVDYTTSADDGGPYDAILDCVGVPWPRLQRALADDGHAGTVVPAPSVLLRQVLLPMYSRRRLTAVLLKPNADDLVLLGGMLDDGRLQVHIEETYKGLDAVATAFTRSMSGRVRGKLVVEPYP